MTFPVPPGIEGKLEHYVSGGDGDSSWKDFSMKKFYTNAFIIQDDKILLGLKKRGFGRDKYNGFGGKVDPGETCLQGAKRELEEEAGIQAPLVHAGTLLFLTEGIEWAFHIDIYRADSFIGTIIETDEMKPEWFSTRSSSSSSEPCGADSDLPAIPYEKMWETDECWLPLLIAKKPFVGRADFVKDGQKERPYKWWYGIQI